MVARHRATRSLRFGFVANVSPLEACSTSTHLDEGIPASTTRSRAISSASKPQSNIGDATIALSPYAINLRELACNSSLFASPSWTPLLAYARLQSNFSNASTSRAHAARCLGERFVKRSKRIERSSSNAGKLTCKYPDTFCKFSDTTLKFPDSNLDS